MRVHTAQAEQSIAERSLADLRNRINEGEKALRALGDKLGSKKPTRPVPSDEVEEIALADDYFVERKLYPNVDFYTGVIYKAMGFPTRMFTVLFALGRLPGWIAHWREMNLDPQTKIGRPQQLYTGEQQRNLPGFN